MQSGLIGRARRAAGSPVVLYIISAIILLVIIAHRLGAQPSGLSPGESMVRTSSHNLSSLLNSPVNLPHNLLGYGLNLAGFSWKTALRLSSALFAILSLFCFFSVVRSWFSKSIGAMGTIILASTPLLLVMARQGSAEIMFFCILVIMAVYYWMLRTPKKDAAVVLLLAACAVFFYTPGVIWWLAGAAILGRKRLSDTLSAASPPAVTLASLLGLLLLVPLGIALAKDWTTIKQLALVPAHFAGPLETLKHLVWMTSAYFIKAPYHSNFILGRLPAINIIQDALLVFGAYALWSAAKAKLLLMLANIGFAIIAAGLNNNPSLLALGVPAFAVIICAGLRYLYIEWRSIFPKNPVAKTLAFFLMWALIAVQLLFGIRYAVIGWPAAADTKQVYVLK